MGDLNQSSVSGPESNVPDRTTDCNRKESALGQVTYETHTVASQKQLESAGNTREEHPHPKITPPTSRLVAGGKQCYHRSALTPSSTCPADLYRCIKRRVGRSLKQAYGKGKLVTPRKQTAHKLSRVKGSSSGIKRISSSLYKEVSSHSYQQYYCGSLYKQGRGNEVGAPVCLTLESTDLVHQKSNSSQNSTYPRPSEHDSRQAIQTGPNHSNRMVPQSRGIPSNMQPVAQAQSGPICHQVQQQASTVCLTGPRPPGLGSGCSQPVMGGTEPLRLSTSSHLGQSGGEVAGLPLQQNHSDCTRVAQHALVLGSSGNVQSDPLCLPNIPNLVSQPFNQVLHKNPSNLNLHAWLLEPQQSRSRASLRQSQHKLRLLKEDQPDLSMRQSGPFLQSGASVIRWTSGHHL